MQLDKLGGRKPAQLSGGQQQRVALARALVFQPSLVLMDEPLGALDKQLREQMQIEIKHLQTSLGITMVYVTHDQSEALTMSDRIAVFHDGRVQQLADPGRFTLHRRTASSPALSARTTRSPVRRPERRGLGAWCASLTGRSCMRRARPAQDNELSVSIRPERLSVAAVGSPAAVNRFAATVKEIFFLGDQVRLVVDAFGGQTLAARLPAKEARHFAAGERIALDCDSDSLSVVGVLTMTDAA